MSGEVDFMWAAAEAKKKADRTVTDCYQPHWRDSQFAKEHWQRVFNDHFKALTTPPHKL